jgi:Mor family transcriptional regulator
VCSERAGTVRPTGRPRKLAPAEERKMLRRWQLGKRLRARPLAKHYGLSLADFYAIVTGRAKYQRDYQRAKLKALRA